MAYQNSLGFVYEFEDSDGNDISSNIGSTEKIVFGITTGYGENSVQNFSYSGEFDGVLPELDVSDKVIISVWLKNYNKLVEYLDFTDYDYSDVGVQEYSGNVAEDFADLLSEQGIDVTGYNHIATLEFVADELQEWGNVWLRFKVDKDESGGGEEPEPSPSPTPTPSSDRAKFYTVYKPTDDVMSAVNNAIFLTSGGSLASVNEYFSSYKKFFVEIESDGERTLKANKYDFGVDCPVVEKTLVEYSCGEIDVSEFYENLIDYEFSRLTIYLPFIGFMDLDVGRVMGHKLIVKYVVDVLSGRCLAQLFTDVVESGSCIAEYGGTIASDEMFGSSGGNEYWGTYELMTTMQLGELSAYVLVSVKPPVEGNVVDYEGLPSKEVVKVGDVTGFVKYDTIWASGMIATESEKKEIESLLKSGVLVD